MLSQSLLFSPPQIPHVSAQSAPRKKAGPIQAASADTVHFGNGSPNKNYTLDQFMTEIAADDPEEQLKAAWRMNLLTNGSDRLKAFNVAIKKTGNPQAQAQVARFIFMLPEGRARNVAFEDAMATGHPLVQEAAAGNIHTLSEGDTRVRAFDAAMDTEVPAVQIIAIMRISSLPEDKRTEAFNRAMDTGNPTVQEEAARIIGFLPEGSDRTNAYNRAMETGNPNVQALATEAIRTLLPEDQRPAYETAMATGNPKVMAKAGLQIRNITMGTWQTRFFRALHQVRFRLATIKAYLSLTKP